MYINNAAPTTQIKLIRDCWEPEGSTKFNAQAYIPFRKRLSTLSIPDLFYHVLFWRATLLVGVHVYSCDEYWFIATAMTDYILGISYTPLYNSMRTKINLHCTQKFSPYVTENTMCVHEKDKSVLKVWFKDAVKKKLPRLQSVGDRMSTEHWWNGSDGGKANYSGKNLSQCHCVHQILHTGWPEINPDFHGARPANNLVNPDHPNQLMLCWEIGESYGIHVHQYSVGTKRSI
jgi:hypothetical protein